MSFLRLEDGRRDIVLVPRERSLVCVRREFQPGSFYQEYLRNFFEMTVVGIEFPPGVEFPYYSFKGKSVDDFHDNLANLIRSSWGESAVDGETELIQSIDGGGSSGKLLRDLLSSCPSPLYGTVSSACRFSFSTIGTACISLPAASGVLTVSVSQIFNVQCVLNIALAAFFFYGASAWSKHKVVQYILGAFFFVVAGALVLVVSFLLRSTLLNKSRTTLILISSALYLSALVAFLKSILRLLLVEYWEIFLSYFVVSGLMGGLCVRWCLGSDATKHVYRVATKWAMRFAGVVLLYNATPSPSIGCAANLALAIVWLSIWLAKYLGRSSRKGVKKNWLFTQVQALIT